MENAETGKGKQTAEEKILIRLRKCGRLLLKEQAAGHSEGRDLEFLSSEEKKTLALLLKKCLRAWERVEN